MQFRLRTLLISFLLVPFCIAVFYLWDVSNVHVAVGNHELNLRIVCNDPKTVSSLKFATADSAYVQTILDNYPSSETVFQDIDDDSVIVPLRWTSKSSRTGRDLGYFEYFDTIIFRIDYHDSTSDFRMIAIPDAANRDGVNLTLDCHRDVTMAR